MPSTIPSNSVDDFLDLHAPLIPQIFRKRWTKSYYLEQVHKARYLPQPAVLFPQSILEMGTRTPWYVIPIVWFPIVTMLALRSFDEIDLMSVSTMWVTGFFGWTLVEYLFHRFLFHVDNLLPDHQLAFLIHFLLHGFHHFLPMDRYTIFVFIFRYRLVMPPVLMFSLWLPWWPIVEYVLPAYYPHAFFSGLLFGYICYDMFHYCFHHSKPWFPHLQKMKRIHLAHHYEKDSSAFGVSSEMWDKVFGTESSRVESKKKLNVT